MVVDSSVVIAVLRNENDAGHGEAILARSAQLVLSAANYVYTVMVLVGKQTAPQPDGLEQSLRNTDIRIEPVTEQDASIARDAFIRYGKGRHPAGLNYGDCFQLRAGTATATAPALPRRRFRAYGCAEALG